MSKNKQKPKPTPVKLSTKYEPKTEILPMSPSPSPSAAAAAAATAASQPKVSEKTGILRFFREMGSALVMALIAIIYVIQAFQIPTGSMENSLKVGDFLLGLKFIYGAPLIPYSRELGITTRLPAISAPKKGDVVIFKYPGIDNKDYIKRLVAGPGDTIEFRNNQKMLVNGIELKLPPKGKYTGSGIPDSRITDFAPLRIPAAGDVISVDETMPTREFLFLKTLVHQENVTKKIDIRFDLYVNGKSANDAQLGTLGGHTFDDLQDGRLMVNSGAPFDFNRIDNWVELDSYLDAVRVNFTGQDVVFRKSMFLDGERLSEYAVRFDNYFMVGDNRDESLDSRYWGYLNWNFVKAKAFMLYFSHSLGCSESCKFVYPNHASNCKRHLWNIPTSIRWDRLGKLIRGWDGVEEEKEGVKY